MGTATDHRARVGGDGSADAERRRLAYDVHDIVAHTLTGTLLHLAEVRARLDSGRPSLEGALDEAERQARAGLRDLRALVAELMGAGGGTGAATDSLAAALTRLVTGFRLLGASVSFRCEGRPGALSEPAARAVQRIAQESLTNAVRHAPGAPVELSVVWRSDRVGITVENDILDPVRAAAGLGVVGMTERAAELGGELRASAVAGRWRVEGWIPLVPVAAAS